MTTQGNGSLSRLLVRKKLDGERLDRFLAAETGLSRRRARTLATDGKVWKNGRGTRVLSKPVFPGDVIDLLVPEADLPNPPWRPEPVVFAHEDRWIVIADKPTGVLSQSAEHMAPNEMAFDEQVLQSLAWREGHRPFLRLVHRLDRLTSGLVVFARNPEALKPIDAAWRGSRVSRYYLAAVTGTPEWQQRTVDEPITKDPGHAWRFRTHATGKPARTRLTVLNRTDCATVLLCELETGRTHQVRVHLQHIGCPVLGDALYGGTRGAADRLMLHAWALALPHPKTRKQLKVTAPIPGDFEQHLKTTDISPPWRNP